MKNQRPHLCDNLACGYFINQSDTMNNFFRGILSGAGTHADHRDRDWQYLAG